MVSERGQGTPKTEEERVATHEALYGTRDMPPRGTGLDSERQLYKTAKVLETVLTKLIRHYEELEHDADAGDNTYNFSRIKTNRILVVTHMSAYNANNACTYIRLGFWNRTRNVWPRIEPAPLTLETVEFNGELYLQEDMWPVVQFNGATAHDNLHALVQGYWVEIPRLS